jgi:hypothetical protein
VGSSTINIFATLGRQNHLIKQDLSSYRRKWHGKGKI